MNWRPARKADICILVTDVTFLIESFVKEYKIDFIKAYPLQKLFYKIPSKENSVRILQKLTFFRNIS